MWALKLLLTAVHSLPTCVGRLMVLYVGAPNDKILGIVLPNNSKVIYKKAPTLRDKIAKNVPKNI